MAVEKLLHITNSLEVSDSEVQWFAGLRNLGFQEVVFFHPPNGNGWKEQLGVFGLQAKTITVDGPSIQGLLEIARQEEVTFISTNIDRQNKGKFRRLDTKELLKTSHVPVMLMPEVSGSSDRKQIGVFDHVIFATDWSVYCQGVMRYLLKYRGIIKELEIIHVVDHRLSIRELRDLRYKLAAWRSAFLDNAIDAESHIYAGKTHEEILQAAKDYGGTCIFMGFSKRSATKRFLRRPYAYRVAEGNTVPTIVVP